jgi:hypothetical protein
MIEQVEESRVDNVDGRDDSLNTMGEME